MHHLLTAGDGQFLRRDAMCRKQEPSFCGDHLVGCSRSTAGRDYVEVRDMYLRREDLQVGHDSFSILAHHPPLWQVSFAFITRCYCEYVDKFLRDYPRKFGSYPDVLIMSSALWDINRWGPKGMQDFQGNMRRLMRLLKDLLPTYTQVNLRIPSFEASAKALKSNEEFQISHYYNKMYSTVYKSRFTSI